MKKNIKQKWIEALRSGRYNKGRLSLRENNTYCCLGVLCDLHRKACRSKKYSWKRSRDLIGNFKYLGQLCFLPTRVVEWAGILDEEDTIIFTLVEMNDSSDESFDSIATVIKKKL